MKRVLFSVLAGSFFTLACSGSDGEKGEKGEPGGPGTGTTDPSAGLVFPNKGLLAREVDVVLTVNDTKLDSGTTLDFGKGITATDITVTSPTALTAHLKIESDAALGKHDVKITSGSDVLTATGAFTVRPAIEVKVDGVAKQGGLVKVTLTNNDTIPFDQDFALDDLGEGVVAVGGGAEGMAGEFNLLISPKATTGKVKIVGANGSGLAYYADPDVLEVAAGTIKDFTSPVAGELVSSTLDVKAYKVAIPASGAKGQIFSLAVSVPKTSALTNASVIWYGQKGTFADFFAQTSTPDDPNGGSIFGSSPLPPPYEIRLSIPFAASAPAAEKYFQLLPSEGKGAVDIASVSLVDNVFAAEAAAAHGTAALAQDLGALPAAAAGGAIVSGELTTDTEKDVYKVTAAAGDMIEIAVVGAPEADVMLTDKLIAAGENDPVFAFAGNGADGAASSITAEALIAGNLDAQKKIFVVVTPYAKSQTKTGKYTVSIRKVAVPK